MGKTTGGVGWGGGSCLASAGADNHCRWSNVSSNKQFASTTQDEMPKIKMYLIYLFELQVLHVQINYSINLDLNKYNTKKKGKLRFVYMYSESL